MIGKRNQFSKFKIVKVENATTNKDTKPAKFLNSDEEEVEEETEKEDVVKVDNAIEQNKLKLHDDDIENKRRDITEIDEIQSNTNPNAQALQTVDNENSVNVEGKKTENLECLSENNSSNSKKRRQRVRQRGKRSELDLDDNADYESSDKYAKWIPPENQTGDGMTELNKKFGY